MSIISTRKCSISAMPETNTAENVNNEGTDDEDDWKCLHRKRRTQLFSLFGLLRGRSNRLMPHWACADPIARHYRGYQLSNCNTPSGSAPMKLETALNILRRLYEKHISTFQNQLRNTPITHLALDNYHNVFSKKDQAHGAAAVTHTGTAYYSREHMEIYIPASTRVRSPSGVHFCVTQCNEVYVREEVSATTWEVHGEITDVEIDGEMLEVVGEIDMSTLTDSARSEAESILSGFSGPKLDIELPTCPVSTLFPS